MRYGRIPGGAVVVLAMLTAGSALVPAAGQTVSLGPNPSECEIEAALLGTPGPGCRAIAVRPPPPAPTPVPGPSAVAVPAPPPGVATPKPALRAAFRINFDFNSARIRPESRAVLDRVGAVMTAPNAGATRFRVIGHTDAVGGDAANLTLSQRRAKAVVDYLMEHHRIRRDRLESSGMGARELLMPGNPKAAENRRVEIVNLGE